MANGRSNLSKVTFSLLTTILNFFEQTKDDAGSNPACGDFFKEVNRPDQETVLKTAAL